jgi:hypothetical protein
MSGLATTALNKRGRTPAWVLLLLALVAALFLAANAHLIYVATLSQPACVDHLRQGQVQVQGIAERGRFAAAQSSCSPLSAERTGSP